MTVTLKSMKGEEFVKKILAGERDFSYIRLEEGFNLKAHEAFRELQTYLYNQKFSKEPIILNYSKLEALQAPGIRLPYLQGKEIDLSRANLYKAVLSRSDFYKGNLYKVNLKESTLVGAWLEETNLILSKLKKAYLEGAVLRKAKLIESVLYGTILARVDMGETDLRRSFVKEAHFNNAYLCKTNFEHVQGIEEIADASGAIFDKNTILTEKQKEILKKKGARYFCF